MPSSELIKLKIDDIPVGTPIAWTLFDEDGDVAFRPGFTFRNREQLVSVARTTPLFRAGREAARSELPAAASKRAPIQPGAGGEESETTLDDIRLHIGEAWQMQPVSDLDQSRYYVKLVGYMKSVSVIVTTPSVDGRALLIREGQPFIVRAFSGKSAYAFKTSVIKSVGSPFPHLHLVYPETVRGMIVRHSERIEVNIITLITPLREGLAKASGVIRNASKTGASLRTSAPIGESGDRLALSFRLNIEDNDYLLSVEGIIRAVREVTSDQGPVLEYGIQLVDLKAIDQLVLGAFVNSLIAHTDKAKA